MFETQNGAAGGDSFEGQDAGSAAARGRAAGDEAGAVEGQRGRVDLVDFPEVAGGGGLREVDFQHIPHGKFHAAAAILARAYEGFHRRAIIAL